MIAIVDKEIIRMIRVTRSKNISWVSVEYIMLFIQFRNNSVVLNGIAIKILYFSTDQIMFFTFLQMFCVDVKTTLIWNNKNQRFYSITIIIVVYLFILLNFKSINWS